MIISKSEHGIIIRRGCGRCGHGLLITCSGTAICVWEDRQFQVNNDFVDELKSLV